MKTEDRELVAQLCASRAGLKIDPDKSYFMESRLAPVARREGYASIEDMLSSLRAKREDRLIWAIVESMITAETRFFRDRPALELFSEEVLPTLAKMREGEAIRIWSAACGAGQEIYSLAMMIEDQMPKLGGAQVELFASDLSERALEKAQSGLYTQFEVQRGLPIRLLVRHFEKNEEMWAISPRLRQNIRWRRVNLAADVASLGRFDTIFCSRVLSTLVPQARAKVLENLALALEPGGFLFLDADEADVSMTDALRPVGGRAGLYARNPAYQRAA
jgi:chemotaxis protein methyltransferase CheR